MVRRRFFPDFVKYIFIFLKSKLLEKFWLAVGGIFVGILLIEIFLRGYYWAGGRQLFGLKPARTTLQFYDNDIFGSAFLPNQKGWFVSGTKEYFTWVETNSQGWPDVEHTVKKPKDTMRILILGDSFVENLQVPLEKRFFRQLETKLNNQNFAKKVEIIALGRGNTGTAQQYLILKNYGLVYEPDLVVHMFLTGNDVKNNSPVLQNDPYLPYFALDESGELIKIPHIKRLQRTLAKIKELLKNLRITELMLVARQKILEERNNRQFGYPLDYHIYDQNYSKKYEEAWKVTEKLILETKKISEQTGASYIMVTLANNEQVNKQIWRGLTLIHPMLLKENLDLEKPDKIMGEFCQKEKINCLHILPYFKEFITQNPQFLTHNFFDGHWNQIGTDLAVKFLTNNLKHLVK